MNVLATIIEEVLTKAGNVDTRTIFPYDFKKLKQLNKWSFMRQLPVFDEKRNYIVVNGNNVPIGTILKRPLDIVEAASSLKMEYHYSFVLGTSINGSELLLEMTKGKDVSVITKKEFLVGRFYEHQIEIHTYPLKYMSREMIIERAKKFEFDIYDLFDLNCKVFVEYVILDILPPKRVIEWKKFQLIVCDYRIAKLKLYLSNPANVESHDFLLNKIRDVKNDKKKLSQAIIELEEFYKKRWLN
jgi:hypothetical protein